MYFLRRGGREAAPFLHMHQEWCRGGDWVGFFNKEERGWGDGELGDWALPEGELG